MTGAIIAYTVNSVVENASEGTDSVEVAYTVAGTHTLAANVENGVITGTVAGLNLTGNGEANVLTGNALANKLTGGPGNDTLNGLDGNDTLDGGPGNDSLVGGPGNDTYVVDNAADVISENVAEGSDLVNVAFTAAGTYVLSDNLENATVTGTVAGINITGNGGANLLTGSALANTLDGADGNDTLNGGGGNDSLYGGDGNDSLDGGDGNDLLFAWGEDSPLGLSSDTNTLRGGNGNDYYIIDSYSDTVIETSASGGIDTVITSPLLTYTLPDYVENLIFDHDSPPPGAYDYTGTGNALANTITSQTGNDTLSGLAGNDTLDSGSGNDNLIGGTGSDSLVGGLGNDVFDFNALSELGLGATRDVISGWNAGDQIDLTTIDWNTTLSGDQAFNFIGASAFTATAGQVRYSGGVLQFNTDTDTAVEYEILITGTPPASLTVGADLLL